MPDRVVYIIHPICSRFRADWRTFGFVVSKLGHQGHRSIKVFMTYPHNKVGNYGLLKIMEVVRNNGALLTLHCENHESIMCGNFDIVFDTASHAFLTSMPPRPRRVMCSTWRP